MISINLQVKFDQPLDDIIQLKMLFMSVAHMPAQFDRPTSQKWCKEANYHTSSHSMHISSI